MRFTLWTLKAALVAGLTLAVGAQANAQEKSVEEFYSSTPLTIVVSAASGGGADFFVRQFAPYLSKHLPGNPEIIIENVPGAGGMAAALLTQERGPFDGSMIVALQRNNFYLPILDETVKFDPIATNWIGSLNKEYYAIVVRADKGVNSPDDLLTTPLIMGATGFSNENRIIPALLNDTLGTKFEIVPGYTGDPEAQLALERGEIDAKMQTVNTILSGNIAEPIKNGTYKVVAITSMTPSPDMPDLPNVIDSITDEQTRAVASFILSPLEAGRPFATPAGVPEDRVEALRAAFDAASSDPEFIAHMHGQDATVYPISGAEVEAIIDGLYATPAPILERVRALVTPAK